MIIIQKSFPRMILNSYIVGSTYDVTLTNTVTKEEHKFQDLENLQSNLLNYTVVQLPSVEDLDLGEYEYSVTTGVNSVDPQNVPNGLRKVATGLLRIEPGLSEESTEVIVEVDTETSQYESTPENEFTTYEYV